MMMIAARRHPEDEPVVITSVIQSARSAPVNAEAVCGRDEPGARCADTVS